MACRVLELANTECPLWSGYDVGALAHAGCEEGVLARTTSEPLVGLASGGMDHAFPVRLTMIDVVGPFTLMCERQYPILAIMTRFPEC